MDAPEVADVRTPQQWLDAFRRYRECRAQPISKLGWAQELMEKAEDIFEEQAHGKRNIHG